MPFYSFQIDTALPRQDVVERIRTLINGEKSMPSNPAPFSGSVDRESFKLHRVIRYRNSFLPAISGKIDHSPTGTRVSVMMFMHPFVAVFMAFWLSMVALFLGITLGSSSPSIALGPGAMLLFGLALTCGGFFPEAFKAKRLLLAALADPVTVLVPPIV
jgi:hypothetical protein